MNTEMTSHLMFTCYGTLLIEHPSNAGCSKAAEPDVLTKDRESHSEVQKV